MEILCIDSEVQFVDRLRREKHKVYSEELGYKTGICNIITPPHEVDVIFFNLQKPACFDMLKWGPDGGNDNFKCTIVKKATNEIIIGIDGKEEPRYRLIYDSQIFREESSFTDKDIIKAVREGGTSLFCFLNNSYMKHTTDIYGPFVTQYYGPFEKTKANKVFINKTVKQYLPKFDSRAIMIKRPLMYKFASRNNKYHQELNSTKEIDVVFNSVKDIFSKLFFVGKGFIWLLPEFKNNCIIAQYLLNNITEIKSLSQAGEKGVAEPNLRAEKLPHAKNRQEPKPEWDVFICHASEDKQEVVEPLVIALKKKNLKVWYDKFTLRIGDHLLQSINKGLSNSQYGIVILSHAFFKKDWPQWELDGLVQKEIGGKKVILPVWHNIRRSDVEKYSPILAGRVAGTTDKGIASLVEELILAMSSDE